MSDTIENKSSGVFIRKGDGFAELGQLPGDGSINEIIDYLGYHHDQVYGWFDTDTKETGIIHAVMEIFTRNVVFVLTENWVRTLSGEVVDKWLQSATDQSIFNSTSPEDILRKGVSNKSLTTEYLSKVLDLGDLERDGVAFAPTIEFYLYFKDGFLVDFQPSDGWNEWAKIWKRANPKLLTSYYKNARHYWPDQNDKAVAEVNAQAEAWAKIPQASQNEFVPLHLTGVGIVNFVMLYVTHYNSALSFAEFAVINHGRFSSVDRSTYRAGRIEYSFSDNGELQNWRLV